MINRMDQSETMVAPVRKVSKNFFAHLTYIILQNTFFMNFYELLGLVKKGLYLYFRFRWEIKSNKKSVLKAEVVIFELSALVKDKDNHSLCT